MWEALSLIIRQNMTNPTMEPLWGGTGTINPALFRLEQLKREQQYSNEWRSRRATPSGRPDL